MPEEKKVAMAEAVTPVVTAPAPKAETPKVVVLAPKKKPLIVPSVPKFQTLVEESVVAKPIVAVSPQTLLEMEAGRAALKKAQNGS